MRRQLAIYNLGRELSPETKPCWTLIWDFQPPALRDINLCCLSQPAYSILLWQLKAINILVMYKIIHLSGPQISYNIIIILTLYQNYIIFLIT